MNAVLRMTPDRSDGPQKKARHMARSPTSWVEVLQESGPLGDIFLRRAVFIFQRSYDTFSPPRFATCYKKIATEFERRQLIKFLACLSLAIKTETRDVRARAIIIFVLLRLKYCLHGDVFIIWSKVLLEEWVVLRNIDWNVYSGFENE
jgi:hypothetical protein